jgi:hypothetical protein
MSAAELLAKIMAYCERTGTPPGYVGKLAFNHPGFVGMLRKRGVSTPASEAAIEEVLALYPDGIPEAELDRRKLMASRSPNQRAQIQAALQRSAAKAALEARPRVYRDPCPRCGARGDIDCGHSRPKFGTRL